MVKSDPKRDHKTILLDLKLLLAVVMSGVLFRLLFVALVFLGSSSLGDAEHVGDGVEEVVEPVPARDID